MVFERLKRIFTGERPPSPTSQSVSPRRSIIGSLGTKYSDVEPVRRWSEYVNAKLFGTEQAQLEEEIAFSYAKLPKVMSYLDRKKAEEWRNLGIKSAGATQRLFAVRKTPVGDQIVDLHSKRAVKAGAMLYTHAVFEQMRRFTQEQRSLPSIPEAISEALEILDFAYAGAVVVPIGDISISDLANGEAEKRKNLSELFSYLNEVVLMGIRGDFGKGLPTFPSELMRLFPETTKDAVYEAVAMLTAGLGLSNMGSEAIRERLPYPKKEFKGTLRMLGRFGDRLDVIRERILEVILDPNTQEHPFLREVFLKYLRNGRNTRIVTLVTAGIRSLTEVQKVYRAAREYEMRDVDPEFYMLLANSTRELIEEGFLINAWSILTSDDLPAILNGDSGFYVVREVPRLEEFGRIVFSTFSKTSECEYDINPSDIQWGRLVVPTSVSVEFDRNRPSKFTSRFFWKNDLGEETNLEVTVDIKKDIFDWSFLEHPSDSDMQEMRETMTQAIGQMLLKIEEDVLVRHREKQEAKKASAQEPPLKRPPRERVTDEVYRLRKQAKKEAREANGAKNVGATSLEEIIEERGVKRTIFLPPEEELAKMLNNLSSADREVVLREIDDFNIRGAGRLKRKRGKSKKGEVLYSFSPKREIRVLLTEVKSGDNGRTFAIADIRYRKEVYRKAGI